MMARHMTIHSEQGQEVVTIFEEGKNKKAVKREMNGSFHMTTLHQVNGHYDYNGEKIEYIKGDQNK